MLRLFIGLGIPFIAVDLMLPWANSVDFKLYDVPFVYLWIFSWFFLTTACLLTCWFVFDRHREDV